MCRVNSRFPDFAVSDFLSTLNFTLLQNGSWVRVWRRQGAKPGLIQLQKNVFLLLQLPKTCLKAAACIAARWMAAKNSRWSCTSASVETNFTICVLPKKGTRGGKCVLSAPSWNKLRLILFYVAVSVQHLGSKRIGRGHFSVVVKGLTMVSKSAGFDTHQVHICSVT